MRNQKNTDRKKSFSEMKSKKFSISFICCLSGFKYVLIICILLVIAINY